MVLAILATDEVFRSVTELNFRGDYDIRHIEAKTMVAPHKKLETSQGYTHLLIDVDALKMSSGQLLAFIERLKNTTPYSMMILANGYSPSSRLVEDLLEIGIPFDDIVLKDGMTLKQFVSERLQDDAPFEEKAEPFDAGEPANPAPKPEPIKKRWYTSIFAKRM